MENKFTGQIYGQNAPWAEHLPNLELSPSDCFLKSVRIWDEQGGCQELPPAKAAELGKRHPDTEAAVCSYVCEQQNGQPVLRGLKVSYTTLGSFRYPEDI